MVAFIPPCHISPVAPRQAGAISFAAEKHRRISLFVPLQSPSEIPIGEVDQTTDSIIEGSLIQSQRYCSEQGDADAIDQRRAPDNQTPMLAKASYPGLMDSGVVVANATAFDPVV